jgi:hypothetical protein
MLGDDVHVVAIGVQRRDAELRPLRSVVAVVVVGGHGGHLVLAEDSDQPPRDRRLPRSRVADDSEDYRPSHETGACSSVSLNTEL